jgi:predicted aspartyl protease
MLATDQSSMDFHIISDADAVVPISVEAGKPIIEVTINGHGPFPMIFDTGAEDILTPEAAAALGLQINGHGTERTSSGGTVSTAYTQVNAVQIGNAEMTKQRFHVIALPLYLTDRDNRPPVAGFMGYEVLARFAVRLDYSNKTITLQPTAGFLYGGSGVHMPFSFTGKTPAVRAAADGIPGTFAIDTGSEGALTLRREFVEQHRLETHHPRGLRIKSGAADRLYETIMTRLDRFDIGDSRIERPATRFPSNKMAGWPPFADVDGSIGYEILRQFIITFNYPRRELWLEHSSTFGTKTVQGTTGFQAIKVDRSGFRVITILPKTPATAAGIMVGDLITAVDSLPAGSMSQGQFGDMMQRPDGTRVQLLIIRDDSTLPMTLTLKELLP